VNDDRLVQSGSKISVILPHPSWRPICSAQFVPLIAAVETADAAEWEELALDIAGRVAATLAGSARPAATPGRRDERRMSEAVRRIEAAGAAAPVRRARYHHRLRYGLQMTCRHSIAASAASWE
jgi:hypothetical protein